LKGEKLLDYLSVLLRPAFSTGLVSWLVSYTMQSEQCFVVRRQEGRKELNVRLVNSGIPSLPHIQCSGQLLWLLSYTATCYEPWMQRLLAFEMGDILRRRERP
jgi:hypothetical protein